jgi:UDP-glucose 4-epimerase
MGETVLVTGGAGYVGSHCVLALLEAEYRVVVVDDLSTGYEDAVPQAARLHKLDLADAGAIDAVLGAHKCAAILHFAARSLVGESMRDPLAYLRDNVANALNLIEAAVRHGIERFVFSSTANLFASPERQPITEAERIDPGSPYGESKAMIERCLHWMERTKGLRSACLRYFNAAGAHPSGTLGERHEPETHLIPLVLQVASGERPFIEIYGTDYPTADGTCIRDYVHVMDLADAHIRALSVIESQSCRLNLGNGHGYSVLQVIEAARRITGHPIPVRVAPRRAGDPPVLVAGSTAARELLGWRPRYADLEDIIDTAWRWHGRRSSEEVQHVAPLSAP